MCNNIRANILKKEERESRIKDKISDWIDIKPTLKKNVQAKKLKKIENGNIVYFKGHPLKLHNKTRVYEIVSESKEKIFQTVRITYSLPDKTKKEVRRIKRYSKDSLDEIEKFLENSQSIQQLYNIDLNRI